MSREELKQSQRSIRKHLVAGLAVVLLLAGGLGGWGSTVPISGALIAPGQVVVESNVKKVQHPTGGVVGEVRVRDGDLVKAGDIVVRLDETVVRANLAIVNKTLYGLWRVRRAWSPNSAAATPSSSRRRCWSAPAIPMPTM